MTQNEVRIIGGLWKGRKLRFPLRRALRPSLGRVRETLFNWLSAQVQDSDCLDLFAGSGALGFEALSRGAQSVTFVERDRSVAQALKDNARLFDAAHCTVRQQTAASFLQHASLDAPDWNIVFLDPPYTTRLLEKTLTLIAETNALRAGGLVYFECARRHELDLEGWRLIKRGTAGDTQFGLLASV